MMRQFVRYAIIGIFNTGLDFAIYTGLTRSFGFWEEHYLWANALTFTIVVTWSFFGNKYWAFKNCERKHSTQYLKFVTVTLVGMSIAESILFIGVDFFAIHDLLAKIIAAPLVVAWNFSAYRFWTFA